ncbi:hypothetical protein ACH4S8_37920 [Streptomyces sp. NPDC021080]|uniref:hypothetical protein n=1 Tax=Streptomyces sp. NPDC021080 TaxID=3365110 RepID=UPI0037A5F0F2
MPDDMSIMFAALSAVFDEVAAAKAEAKAAHFNSPAARAARSARSQKAAATMRARREAQRAQEELENELEARRAVGPVCDAFGIIPLPSGPHETNCARSPHLHGDHEDIDGNAWPSYEGEFDEMLTLTTDDLRQLLASQALEPVLYIVRDEDTGEAIRVEVGPQAYAPHDDIVGHRHELVDDLGGPDHPDGVTKDALEHLVEGWQNALEDVLQAEGDGPDGVYNGEVR